jgi:hypothetical protein
MMSLKMTYSLQRSIETGISVLRPWWNNNGTVLLRIAVALLTLAAIVWMGYEFWRLLWESTPIWRSSPEGAVDLKIRYRELHDWFSGSFVQSPYPPATFVILWPLLGWLSLTASRWLWAISTIFALGGLIYLIVRESTADTALERAFVGLIPLSMYATGATIGNGQMIVHILPLLVFGLLLLYRRQRHLYRDLLAAALLLVTLVKPSISVPFFWIVLFVPGRLRPILLVMLGYIALTLFSASFQETRLSSLIHNWLENASRVAMGGGHANLHVWLTALGLEELILPASFFVLLALGLWVYRHRNRDIWLLMSVSAIVARFWAKHWWFDDLLILLPMIALFRIAKQSPSTDSRGVLAGLLLSITVLLMLAPGGLFLFPPPWNMLYASLQTIVWIVVLIFLLEQTRREQGQPSLKVLQVKAAGER